MKVTPSKPARQATATAAPPCQPPTPPEKSAVEDTANEQDIEWMRRIQQGDLNALDDLIRAHQARVIGTAARMLGDDLDAEDIAQQVFVRVWNSAGRYKPTAKFTTWLLKIARNLVFNELRRRKRHPAVSMHAESDAFETIQYTDHSVQGPDAMLLNSELQRAIDGAIAALPEVQRMAIVLRRYQELSYEEIAEVLELSVPAVKSVLFRARTLLREKLQKYLDAE